MENINYLDQMPSYCIYALKTLNDSGFEAYAVGGAVRDLVMGRKPHDFDIATSATPDEIIESMQKSGIYTIDMARKHGTITAVIENNNVEITSYRTEGTYKDNRHPDSVEFTRSIEEDVKRRDFTMNALYLNRNGRVVDLNDGITDIENKVIRCVGDAATRFEEDALRIMRGLRFAAELGFKIEETTSRAMFDKRNLLKNISGERIYTEFTKLITAPHASNVLREYLDIFAVFIPVLSEVRGFNQHSKYHNLDVLEHTLAVLDGIPLSNGKREEDLSYAALFHDLGKPEVFKMDEFGQGHMKGHAEVSMRIWDEICSIIKPSTKIHDNVSRLIKYHDSYPQATNISVHRFMTKHGLEFLNKLHVLQNADILAHNETAVPRFELLRDIQRIETDIKMNKLPLSRSELDITGAELIKLGIKADSNMRAIFEGLLNGVIEGKVNNRKDELKEYALTLSLDNIN
ncbi:MAG: HD domain-containing protein [Clostridia bacterium]|nr:HD domain-containing protein [Clostridia bacterium]